MNNFTPLRSEKKKKKINKFFHISSILMILMIGITGYYLRLKMLTYNSMAIPKGKYTDYGARRRAAKLWEEAARDKEGQACAPGTIGCVAPYVGGITGWHYSVCANGAANAYCNEELDKKLYKNSVSNEDNDIITNVTATSTPTSTPVPTNIPTNTPTPTIIVTSTPTLTKTPTITPTATIISLANPTITPTVTSGSTITNTPGQSSTPTEIILAKTSLSPTLTTQLLQTGVIKSFIYIIPSIIILVGLIL